MELAPLHRSPHETPRGESYLLTKPELLLLVTPYHPWGWLGGMFIVVSIFIEIENNRRIFSFLFHDTYDNKHW